MDSIANEQFQLMLGDSMKKLKELPENSIDAIVTDPPYALVHNSLNGSAQPGDMTMPYGRSSPSKKRGFKPTELMRYLVRLVTPPGGTVLDPFMDSGPTGKACALEGLHFIGIERERPYIDVARRRIEKETLWLCRLKEIGRRE
jgi:DNA modification methylase